jgi:urease subunit gamma
MDLTPREKDKLLVFTAALWPSGVARGLKLNYPEAVALITAAILKARAMGVALIGLMSFGTTLLTRSM